MHAAPPTQLFRHAANIIEAYLAFQQCRHRVHPDVCTRCEVYASSIDRQTPCLAGGRDTSCAKTTIVTISSLWIQHHPENDHRNHANIINTTRETRQKTQAWQQGSWVATPTSDPVRPDAKKMTPHPTQPSPSTQSVGTTVRCSKQRYRRPLKL